jgi:D-glycero-D-manno-heptose 1,7-bisphosphate phosphatase
MLLRAAADLRLDLTRSWLVGDILDDVEAGNRAGCRTILVDLGTERPPSEAIREPDFVARDTRRALQIVCAAEGVTASNTLDFQLSAATAWPHAPHAGQSSADAAQGE